MNFIIGVILGSFLMTFIIHFIPEVRGPIEERWNVTLDLETSIIWVILMDALIITISFMAGVPF